MRPRLAVILILLAGVAVYWPVFSAQFTLWDDPTNTWQNPQIAQGRGISSAWTSTADAIYMPIPRTVWALLAPLASQPADAIGSTLSPRPYHTANLLIHLANALLVFRLLRALKLAVLPSTIGAMLFLVHLLQVEAVAWVSGLKDLLAACFSVMAMTVFINAAKADEKQQGRSRWILAGLALAAVLSKPTALVLPLILFAMDRAVLGRPVREVARGLWPVVLISILAALIGVAAQPALLTPPVAVHLRPIVAADALMFYLRQFFWPVSLGLDYGRTPRFVLGSAFWLPALFVTGLTAGCFVAWKRGRRLEVLGLLIFAIALLPVLGLKRFEFQYYSTVADHYVYLAMAGLAVLFASVSQRVDRRLAGTVALVALTSSAVLAHRQARTWHNTGILAHHALEVNPNSIAARTLLGGDHDFKAAALLREGRTADAVEEWQRSLEAYDAASTLDPKLVPALDAAATICWRLRNLTTQSQLYERRAMEYWRAIDALLPTLPEPIRANFTELPSRLGKIALDLGMNEEATGYFERAVVARPDDPNAHAGLRLARERQKQSAASQPITE